MTPEWLFQVIWYSAGVGGTGALWYFLSERNYHAAIWTGFATGVVVLLAVALHIRNSILQRKRQTDTNNPSPLPDQPTPANLPAEGTSSSTQPSNDPKIFLQVKSPDEIVTRIKSLNPLERKPVTEQTYAGRWVRWSGTIIRIEPFSFIRSGGYTVSVDGGPFVTARLEFLPIERHLVEPLQESDLISYEAKIATVDSTEIYLTDVTLTRPEERTFVDRDPAELTGIFEEHTAIQATKRVAESIGKWIKVSGSLDYVGNFTSFVQVTFKSRSPDPIVYMYFRKRKWFDLVSVLNKGDKIIVIGRIKEIRHGELHLDNCELVDF